MTASRTTFSNLTGSRLFLRSVFLFLVGMLMSSCEEGLIEPYETFIIPEGKNYSGYAVQALQSKELRFTAIFDESAIYQAKDPVNQFDIHKLMGFADCNDHHHANSARFGWRWMEDKLEIHTYVYNNGERYSEYVGDVNLNEPNEYSILMTDDQYIFTLNNSQEVRMNRTNECTNGVYFMLFPYYGGDERAPHDINIQIKIAY